MHRSRVFLALIRGYVTIQDTTKRVRVNRQIRISPVRVIGADGSQLGIIEVDAAIRMAEEAGLDLVEVAATARPPVVRIMDYGKYKFEMAKQARQAKKKQHVIELKEVKFRPGIDDHDFMTKTRHARRFLEEKNKVKVTMMFRGRQVAHPEDVVDHEHHSALGGPFRIDDPRFQRGAVLELDVHPLAVPWRLLQFSGGVLGRSRRDRGVPGHVDRGRLGQRRRGECQQRGEQ